MKLNWAAVRIQRVGISLADKTDNEANDSLGELTLYGDAKLTLNYGSIYVYRHFLIQNKRNGTAS